MFWYKLGRLFVFVVVVLVGSGTFVAWREADHIRALPQTEKTERMAQIATEQERLGEKVRTGWGALRTSVIGWPVKKVDEAGDISAKVESLPPGSGLAATDVTTVTLIRELLLTWGYRWVSVPVGVLLFVLLIGKILAAIVSLFKSTPDASRP